MNKSSKIGVAVGAGLIVVGIILAVLSLNGITPFQFTYLGIILMIVGAIRAILSWSSKPNKSKTE